MKIIRSDWPEDRDTREVTRFLWFPRTMITRATGKLSETRWLEITSWKQQAFVESNGTTYWWNDLHWID